MGVLPPRDSKTQRPETDGEMGKRDEEIDAGAPETGRDRGTAGQRVTWEMLTQRRRHRARDSETRWCPNTPILCPRHSRQGQPLPSCQAVPGPGQCTLVLAPVEAAGGSAGPGGRGSHQDAGLWPLPSDSPCSRGLPSRSPPTPSMYGAPAVYLKCPLASPGTLSSPLSLPVPSACSSCASGSLPWRKWSFIKFLSVCKAISAHCLCTSYCPFHPDSFHFFLICLASPGKEMGIY